MTREIATALMGVGHVGRSFLKILIDRGDRIEERYGLRFKIVLAADSSGLALSEDGIDAGELLEHKLSGGSLASMPGYTDELNIGAALDASRCELLLDATPVDLMTGEPGLGMVRAALSRGIRVVLANKSPLVLEYASLHRLAAEQGTKLAFSATVCGGLPVINCGQRDLIGADIQSVAGIFNSTSNFILGEIEAGRSFDEALTEAQARGIAEADPSLDIEGWDTANKLVIIVNSVLDSPARLEDVSVEGIVKISPDEFAQAHAEGNRIKLVARAERRGDGYTLRVGPERLPADSFLAACGGWEMGIIFETDLYETLFLKIREESPIPTAAAMLRDAVHLH